MKAERIKIAANEIDRSANLEGANLRDDRFIRTSFEKRNLRGVDARSST